MSGKLVFDAIVVGAGPAGVAAAITMARGGLQVILLERGRFAGAKNLFGGVLYTHALAEVLPDYWQRKPPFERPVTEQGYWLLAPDSAVRFMHKSEHYKQEPAEAYTALRAPFDAWFAEQAVQAGVLLIAKTTAERVPELITRVKSLHGYTCPCIVSLAVEEGYPPFLEWVAGSVTPV